MATKFNTDKIHYFVLIPEVAAKVETDGPNTGKSKPAIGSIGFRTYTDRAGVFGRKGASVEYVTSRDDKGRDKGKYFTLDQAHNAFQVREGDTDVYDKSMFDFLKNSPFCEGSPNGTYATTLEGDKIQLDVKYRLMNTEADAEVALEASLNRAKAISSAGEIDDQTLLEVAAVGIGFHGKPDKIMRHKVVEWANKRPNDYFDTLNSGDRLVRALIRKAIADGIFQIKGSLIYWGNTMVGTDEDAAVKALVDDKELLEGLQEKVDLKAKAKIENPKKPRK